MSEQFSNLNKEDFEVDELVCFCRLLSAASRSGVPLVKAVERLGKGGQSSQATEWLNQLADKLKSGYNIEEAVQSLNSFDPVLAKLMPLMGDDRLVSVIENYTKYLIRQNVCVSRVRYLVGYPIVIFAVAVFVLIYLNFYLFPQFATLTQPLGFFNSWSLYLLNFADSSKWPLSLIVPCFIFYLTLESIKIYATGRLSSKTIWGKLTGFDKALFISRKARVAGLVSLYLRAGYSLEESIERTSQVIDDADRKELLGIERMLINGNSLADSFRDSELFKDIIYGNESSDEIADKLEMMSNSLNSEAIVLLKRVSSKSFLIGLAVAAIVVLLVCAGAFDSYALTARSIM